MGICATMPRDPLLAMVMPEGGGGEGGGEVRGVEGGRGGGRVRG